MSDDSHPALRSVTTTPEWKTPWHRHVTEWSWCKDCGLGETCANVVLGRGRLPCDVVFVGEAPGKDEDAQAVPFVGKAGKVFNWLVADAVERVSMPFQWAVTNVVGCRPLDDDGQNRPPTEDEAATCSPRVAQFLLIARPRAVVLMGKTAQKLTRPIVDHHFSGPIDMGRVGWVAPYEGPLEIVHPAYILRAGGIGGYQYTKAMLAVVDFVQAALDAVEDGR